MKRVINPNTWATVIVVLTIIIVASITLFEESAVDRFLNVNESWTSYLEKESRIQAEVYNLREHIGYGGLIHNYKNYLLRGDEEYKRRLDDDSINVQRSTIVLLSLLPTEKEREVLGDIQGVIDEYFSMIKIISEMLADGSTPREIDSVVKVDDTPAIEALRFLQHESAKRTNEVREKTDTSLVGAISFLLKGRLISIPIVLVAFLLISFTRKLVRSNIALKEAQETLVESEKMAALGCLVAGVVTCPT